MSQVKILDCRGLSCPLPVVNTKKELAQLSADAPAEFVLTVLVDNATAAENVSRFARSSGCLVKVEPNADAFHILISSEAGQGAPAAAGAFKTQAPTPRQVQDHQSGQAFACRSGAGSHKAETVMLVTSSSLGRGSEELGEILMRSFFFTLKEAELPPARIYFLSSGVKLTVEGSPLLEELQELAERGVEIFSCGTCLDYYQVKEKLRVGSITNMYDTMDALLAATRCITV